MKTQCISKRNKTTLHRISSVAPHAVFRRA